MHVWKGPGVALELDFGKKLGSEYARIESSPHARYDFESVDRKTVIELKLSLQGVRDLDSALMQLASVLAERREISRAVLVARFPKMTAQRVSQEWERALQLLRPELARRLGLVALAVDREVVLPERNDILLRLLDFAELAFSTSRLAEKNVDLAPAPWSSKHFEIWKVLLNAWLDCEGHLPVKEIMRRSHCSLPTVSGILERLQAHDEVERATNRGAGFSAMPRRSLEEILPFLDGLRQSRRFVDASGSRPDPEGLLRRMTKNAGPDEVTIGGIPAARHYAPDFDLNGLPRLDVSLNAEDPTAWIQSIDPALRLARREERSPVLVLHRYYKPALSFEKPGRDSSKFAEPVEVLLDLLDLRLNQQAEDFVRTLRKKGGARGSS